MDSSISGLVFLVTAFLLFLSWGLWSLLRTDGRPSLRSVAVLVLGDIGRSPRMMYHAESFAKIGFDVYFIGYRGSRPIPSLTRLPRVRFMYLPEPPVVFRSLPFIILAPFKILHQIHGIVDTFNQISNPPEFIIVQNPPSIPTLALVWLFSLLRGSKVIIDWHNLGYSILGLKLGKTHLFVRLAERFEATFGRVAYAHLFVTDAMHTYLSKKWSLKGEKAVLHDRPPHHFHRSAAQETHDLFLRLLPSLKLDLSLNKFFPSYDTPFSTPFTSVFSTNNTPNVGMPAVDVVAEANYEMPEPRADRPALLVSSTSWTADEDFSILIDALRLYERAATIRNGELPKVLCLITGKGPLRDSYMKKVDKATREEKWHWVRCISTWLEAEDYPLLLGSADIGVSLHSSSSGLDLPMKVVDMFGCGLPVCALDFACIHELVKDGINGVTFKNATELSDHLCILLENFPNSHSLKTLQDSLSRASTRADPRECAVDDVRWHWGSWEDNWNRVVRPLVLYDVTSATAAPPSPR